MSTGGLEPPQLSPHAPQACVSTIPPHRHKWFKLFLDVESLLVVEGYRPLSKNVTFSHLFLGRVPASTKMICVYPSISISFCKCLSSITQKYNLQLLKYLKGKILWPLILLVHKVCKVEI